NAALAEEYRPGGAALHEQCYGQAEEQQCRRQQRNDCQIQHPLPERKPSGATTQRPAKADLLTVHRSIHLNPAGRDNCAPESRPRRKSQPNPQGAPGNPRLIAEVFLANLSFIVPRFGLRPCSRGTATTPIAALTDAFPFGVFRPGG